MKQNSIIRRALKLAIIRISLVATLAGVISYLVNSHAIKKAVIEQLTLSTQERLQSESLPFKDIKSIHNNYLAEFKSIYEKPERQQELINDFDKIFYIRPNDNSIQERPEIFQGTQRINGQTFHKTSGILDPETKINDDIKTRLTLSFILSQKYGSVTENQLFDFCTTIPEKGSTIFWSALPDKHDLEFSGPHKFNLDDQEYFQISYNHKGPATKTTNIYYAKFMKLWMVTVMSTPEPNAEGKQLYSVGTDVVLDQLINRTAKPSIQGSKAVIFRNDENGTFVYHPDKMDEIQKAAGKVSIKSIKDAELLPVLNALKTKTESGKTTLLENKDFIYAFGIIPETDWCMSVQYPKNLMRPAILQNLFIVIGVGFLTLLVEIFLLRSILMNQVARPLTHLLSATRLLGTSNKRFDKSVLPINTPDEIGELARDFATMAERVQNTRDNLEDTVIERTRELETAKNLANSANKAKSMFLANMSHEIRTPMHGILGMATSLRRAGVTPQQEDKLNKIDTAAEHLLSIINDILDLSKIEAGRFTLEDAPVCVNGILNNVSSILSERAESKGLRILIETEAWGNNLFGDSTRLQQALLNYANNAIKFTEKGTITLRAIKKEETNDSVIVYFEVKDTGIGIPPEILPKLFNAFEQADNSTTRKYGGTGLGLVITKLLAELMGGKAGAESILSVGSSFWFTALLKKKDIIKPQEVSTNKNDPEKIISQRYSGKTILIVDDEPINRELVKFLLEDAKLVVATANNGKEAISKAQESKYDLIIMDMQMPIMGGLEATRHMRNIPNHKNTPIIAMTANAFAEDKHRCMEAGMNDILVKPFDPEELFAKVLQWLDQSAS